MLFAAQRSALVVALEEQPVLLTVEELALGQNRGLETLGDLEGPEVPVVFRPLSGGSAEHLRAAGVDVARWPGPGSAGGVSEHLRRTRLGLPHEMIDPGRELDAWAGDLLARTPLDLAIIDFTAEGVILLSRHETLASLHAGPPKGCWCENPDNVHSYGSEKQTGDPCDYDAYSVECRR